MKLCCHVTVRGYLPLLLLIRRQWLKANAFTISFYTFSSSKDSDAERDRGQEEKGTTEDEMAGWHHWLNGRESGWTPGVGDGQRGLACCASWGRKESDTTERLIWSDLIWSDTHRYFWAKQTANWIMLCIVIKNAICNAIVLQL